MHDFFGTPPLPFTLPRRLYAKLIDWEPEAYALFDCVDAADFDRFVTEADGAVSPEGWSASIDQARIYAVGVNRGRTPDENPAALKWLKKNTLKAKPDWRELILSSNPEGPAEVYNNIAGEPERTNLAVSRVTRKAAANLKKAVDLKPDIKPDPEIVGALPAATIEKVFVLDVGQGAANALVNANGNVVGYVDLGAGVLKDTGTWPTSNMQICLAHRPTVILSHWHYDHFQAANKFTAAQSVTWIAPFQVLGPGPQSAMATALRGAGGLKVWNAVGGSKLRSGSVEIERCTGTGSQNRDGIAVWIHAPDAAEDPILLPGDAGYTDISSLPRKVHAFVVAHHGGSAAGKPSDMPKPGVRAALSYGHKNSYGHPLTKHLTDLGKAGWSIGHPHAAVDERRTEDRKSASGAHSTGGAGLGHIRLDWLGATGAAHSCRCGCTLNPTQ
jgi:beta-lactamase superfamily II metal-dependent hydrolase